MNARTLFFSISFGLLTVPLLTMRAHAQSTLPGPLPSQSTPPVSSVPKDITLDEAIKAAITRNYTVRTAGNTTRRDEIEAKRASDNQWLPTASASAGYQYKYSLTPQTTSFFVQTDTLGGGASRVVTLASGSQSLSYDASANYNLYNGSRSNLTWTRQQIAFTVTSDYLNVLRTDELVTAATQSLEEAIAQLGLTRGKFEAGVLPIGQVYQQDAVVAQDSLSFIQARNNYENAKADLLFELNLPPNAYNQYNLSLTGIDTSTSPAARAAVDTSISDARINTAIDARPDITAERHTIEAQIANIDAIRGSLYPKLDANAGIQGGGSNSDLTRVQLQHGLFFGLSLSVPIFDKMQNRLLIAEEEIDVETQRIQLEQQVQQIRSDAAKAVNNLRSSDEALDASDAGLRSAVESLRLAEERLRVGAGTQVDVIIAEAAVETARTNRVNAKFNYVLAERQLAYALGQTNY